jgi:polyhydroxyalkanoate synthesis regulator phasin
MPSTQFLDSIRDLLSAANLITREDMARLEERVDELEELVTALETRMQARAALKEPD